jgi:NAD(P)-dependent dehydrogenase (short-subunit alcohol dehydrogenase family)
LNTFCIIGASSGIGAQLTRQLLAAGHRVLGTWNSQEPSFQHPQLEWHPLNILEELPDLSFLPDTIHGLAYCPGSISLKPFARIKPEDFAKDYQLQVLGAIKVLQAALPGLKNAEQASVVLFSTVAVQSGFNFHTLVSSSKGAIEGLTRALAAELAPKVRVNAIAPSITETPLAASLLSTEEKRQANAQRHPLRKVGTPEDISNLAEFLLSPKSGWITGQIMHVDGGMSSLKV